MTLSITFYDSIVYHRQDFINRDSDFFGNGVVHPATSQFSLTYPATPNMTVNVGAGTAWVDGYRIANDSNAVTLTVPAADAANPRIDIIQIGHDDTNSTYSLMVKKGVAAATPTEPGADQNYIKLYAINVAANATSITSTNVTDRRSLLPLNVDGTQIVQGGSATTGANTFSGTQTAPTFVATSATEPLQLPFWTSNPAQTAPSGTLGIVNDSWVYSDGTAWKSLPVPWSAVTGAPTDYAKTDVSQTWTQPQTWSSNQTFPWSGVSSKPTTVSGYGIAGDSPTWTGTHTFNNAISGNVTGSAGSVAWSGVTGKPNVAAYDASQTWTADQTFMGNFTSASTTGSNLRLDGNAGSPTTAPKAQAWYISRNPQINPNYNLPKMDLSIQVYDGTTFSYPVGFDYTNKIVGVATDSGWTLRTQSLVVNGQSVTAKKFQSRIPLYRNSQNFTTTTNTPMNTWAATMMPFVYHASEWLNNTFVAEFQMFAGSGLTAYAGLWDYTTGTAVSGSEVSTTQAGTGTPGTLTPVRTASTVTLTDGHYYGFYGRSSSTSAITVLSADIIALF